MSAALGAPCDAAATSCADGLSCACAAYQRRLHVCQPPELHDNHERRGLSCERATHPSARIMSAPPLRAVAGVQAVSALPEVAAWARRYPFYADGWYTSILASDGVGLPVLAGAATPRERVDFAARLARIFLVDALREPAVRALAAAGTRIVVASKTAEWPQHPEGALAAPGLVWASGLGGGAPWFPTTGVEAETSSVIEELFHTLQYTVLPPRAVCSYYALYRAAARRRLYTPRFLEGVLDPSEPAEPVPTSQADEYFAMAMLRWFEIGDGFPDEYNVAPGRESLWASDPGAWCLLSTIFRPEATLNGTTLLAAPDRAERCAALLGDAGRACPAAGVAWPADGALRSVTLAVSLVFIAAPLAAVAALVLLTLLPRRAARGAADVEALWPLEEMRAAYT